MAVRECRGSAGTGSPRALGPGKQLQGGTLSSPPSGEAHSGLHVPPSPPPLPETARSSLAELNETEPELLMLGVGSVFGQLGELEIFGGNIRNIASAEVSFC